MPSTVLYENPDLKRERQHCSFDKEEITHLFDGGAQKTKNRRELGILYSFKIETIKVI